MSRSTAMYHDGDLNSGISAAIAQNKLVACFVQDGEYNSRIWEEYWLQDLDRQWDESTGPPLVEFVLDKAVMLKIEKGSKEAEFLNAFCLIESVPMFVVIDKGKVLEKVEEGVSREEFTRRISKAIGVTVGGDEEGVSQPAASVPETAPTPVQPEPVQEASQSSESVQAMLAERGQRLEVERIKREAAEKAERVARRRQEAEEAAVMHREDKGKQPMDSAEDSYKAKARHDWIYQQKQRKDEAKRERVRILEQIENDKLERKLKAQKLKEVESLSQSAMPDAPASKMQAPGGMCHIQVRLLDGSGIRTRFAPDTTLAVGVRKWIKDSAEEDNVAYTFKHVLPPSPSRNIEVGEEKQSLQELGLAPNANLILVPVTKTTDAYVSQGVLGYLYTFFDGLCYLILAIFRFFGSLLGTNRASQPDSRPSGESTSVSSALGSTDENSARMRVKTLADQRAEAAKKGPNEFYNGNSLGFESRKDDADEDENKK